MMNDALIQVRRLQREYPTGDETLVVLNDVDLDIRAGEMVAIVGQSGSGKSTLMNILGCLDRPTSGSYRFGGRETGGMEPDELATLRREHFGFIFQRYHLLGELSATGNVEVPAIYAGMGAHSRRARSQHLLARLGLSQRSEHTPSQLSGGQQQRVSIARALMNGGDIILADEPTGALDSRSGAEVMTILKELHAEGHTIVLVTHDMGVAEHAQRVIELRDGRIVADRRKPESGSEAKEQGLRAHAPQSNSQWQAARDRLLEAFRMALLAMNAHRMRTFLTMLGIIIGIASVVSVVALGAGAQQQILSSISSLGTNTIDIFPGSGFGDLKSKKIETLMPGDVEALAKQRYVDGATPNVSTSVTAQYGNQSATASVNGVGYGYFITRGMEVERGRFFRADAVNRLQQVVVIDQNMKERFFARQEEPIGKIILLGKVPARVVAVAKKQNNAMGDTSALNVWVPYTVVSSRMLGQQHLSSVTVRVADNMSMSAAENAIGSLLERRHGTRDFYMSNSEQIRETIEKTTGTMRVMIGAIAAIALVVGGIGVMNIMLVSVTERTREIGVRMAVGARQSDIQQQFLIESVIVCLLGGMAGVGVALTLGAALDAAQIGFSLVFSTTSIISAFACSSLIGIVFGFMPARSAARLDPVEALSRE
nr:MacB family efflux pump subunit [Pseudomonas fulva]